VKLEGNVCTVFGAGSVGTVLAALLGDAGIPVRLAGRDAVPDLRIEGDQERVRASVPVVTEPEGTLLLCVHEEEVAAVTARWPGRRYVTFCNGVEGEKIAARHGQVIGGVWRMTCTLIEPGRALFTKRGRVVVGRHPRGVDDETRRLEDALRAAGLDVGLSSRITRDVWLKLFVNLAGAPNALIRKQDHESPAFGAVKRRLLEEAREVFARAGIEATSCDGRDASLDQEIERQARGGGRSRPVYNSIWRRLSRGRAPGERHHATVVQLARESDVPAPANAAMQRLLDAASEPECYAADEVLAQFR